MTVIRKGTKDDIPGIMKIKREVLELFSSLSDPQWNGDYPDEEDFIRDIGKGSLFVAEEEEGIAGFAVLEKTLPKEYEALPFQNERKTSFHFCRFALSREERGSGLSSLILDYVEKKARSLGALSLFADTHETNLPMQKFLAKHGFGRVAEFRFIPVDGNFVAFEKEL